MVGSRSVLMQIKQQAGYLTLRATACRIGHQGAIMSQSIPFIRAAAIAPMRRWLNENDLDSEAFLDEALVYGKKHREHMNRSRLFKSFV